MDSVSDKENEYSVAVDLNNFLQNKYLQKVVVGIKEYR